MLKLDPTLYFITDSTYSDREHFLHVVEEACKGGPHLSRSGKKMYPDGSIWSQPSG